VVVPLHQERLLSGTFIKNFKHLRLSNVVLQTNKP
jgi:hypothetical protein